MVAVGEIKEAQLLDSLLPHYTIVYVRHVTFYQRAVPLQTAPHNFLHLFFHLANKLDCDCPLNEWKIWVVNPTASLIKTDGCGLCRIAGLNISFYGAFKLLLAVVNESTLLSRAKLLYMYVTTSNLRKRLKKG